MKKNFLFVILSICLCNCAIYPAPIAELMGRKPEVLNPLIPGLENLGNTKKTITLSFSGDIMAHDINFQMKDYSKIYEDVESFLLSDGVSFGNIEMPVCDELPLSSYPRFNVHSDYLKASINAGFDAFSFANNHTNDQYVKGIMGTIASFETLKKEFSHKNRMLYASGVKSKSSEDFQATLIEKDGFRILFLAITELLNSYDSSKNFVYCSYLNESELLAEKIKKMKKEIPCDLFVLSVHVNEKEYYRGVLEEKRERFKMLAKAGADIIWANHPHVVQGWEEFTIEEDLLIPPAKISDVAKKVKLPLKIKRNTFFMYSLGNFISGQRRKPNYQNPEYYWEYTGDTVLMQLKIEKDGKMGITNIEANPILLTVYNSQDGIVVKQFTPEWIKTLPKLEQNYYNTRYKLMKDAFSK